MTQSKSGVTKRDAVKLFGRMRSGTIDAGVRSVAKNEAPKPKLHPPRKILQPRAKIDRPSEQWQDTDPETMGSLKPIKRR